MSAEISKINRQRIVAAFPDYLQQDAEVVADFLLNRNLDLHPSLHQEVSLLGQKLTIPGRIYSELPLEEATSMLSAVQQAILNCLFLRHHNGFVRQKCLERLVDINEYFITPFVVSLLGEYVIEILFVADKVINSNTVDNYIAFIVKNTEYWDKTKSRVISYWNEYYRRNRYEDIREYIGMQIANRLDKAKWQSGVG
ncbi:hypothetical protein KBK19_14480 [Microvirga sp. STR05]|uniref:Uncharacterized protein n=1 Tax=Hymenobacter duratus TaxID=2771356 RepID=A0ABR8JHC4_9BACT|nr:hypothetical protein [Hymenobacter duratus]MBD2716243.1 hypothetical protein [Hymenobacter duratus]MBR7951159.1 hypothetical protein [Microvirga sp. STR05]